MHDATVFRESSLSKKLETACQQPNGENKYALACDSAYAITPWTLTPYRNVGTLSRKQKRFNKLFAATRGLIENAFALLKQRFRQLLLLDFHTVDKMTKFIISCCVLHNVAIDAADFDPFGDEEPLEDDGIDEEEPPPVTTFAARQLKQLGEMKRDRIAESLYNTVDEI